MGRKRRHRRWPSPPAVLDVAADELVGAALVLGGTITGEHRVGLVERRWLGEELGAGQPALQRQIRAVFDPRNILSPRSFVTEDPVGG